MLRKKFFLMVTTAGALSFAATSASAMRCGTHLVHSGERHGHGKYEVLKKCGKPKARVGNSYVYEKYGDTYVVKFDDAGRVLSIED